MKVEFIPDKKTENILENVGDKVSYAVARMTLDYVVPHIPMSKRKRTSGQLRRSTLTYGVRGSNGNYSIGSVTSYASYVYAMENVKWTTPDTYGKWFHTIYKEKGTLMLKNAMDKYGR